MQDLIERLEKATGPDRIVEHQIRRLLEGKSPALSKEPPIIWVAWDRIRWVDGTCSEWPDTPRYTASIDAALTLVPEGMDWDVSQVAGVYSGCVGFDATADIDVRGQTPAIALCIAALKARSTTAHKAGE